VHVGGGVDVHVGGGIGIHVGGGPGPGAARDCRLGVGVRLLGPGRGAGNRVSAGPAGAHGPRGPRAPAGRGQHVGARLLVLVRRPVRPAAWLLDAATGGLGVGAVATTVGRRGATSFEPGHWDYALDRRGVLFAPVYFPQSVYSRAGFSYSPSIAIDVGVLSANLFVNPRYDHYYFRRLLR